MLTMAGAWCVQGFGMFSVIEAETGLWVGRAGPWHPHGWPGTEVGWGISRDRWGRGYATEASATAIDWAFERLGWTEVIHCIDPANVASAAVARRLGSRNRGPVAMPAPYDGQSVDLWGQSREEWTGRRRGVGA